MRRDPGFETSGDLESKQNGDRHAELLAAYKNAAGNQLEDALAKIRHCLAQLEPSQIWWRPREEMNSIGNILLHLNGNVRQWLIAGLSDAADNRQRQLEFDDRSERSSQDLLSHLQATVDEAIHTINQQDTADLLTVRRVQEYTIDGFQAMENSIGHFCGHVQEIVHMSRCMLGKDYAFQFVPQEAER